MTTAPATAPISARRIDQPRHKRAVPWAYIVLTAGLVLMIGPFLWMVLGSVKPAADFLQSTPTFLPSQATTDNYTRLFEQLDFPRYFFNSAVIALAVTVGTLIFCPMLGYALAKLRWHGKGLIMALVLATLMVPAGVTLIPNFILMSNLGLVNTYPGLILPFLAGPFGVFLMRQFMMGLPDELIDAARVDGAGEWRIFTRVIMPLCKPALATLGILTFLTSWNNFLWPLVVAQTEDTYTLPVALALFSKGQNATNYGLLLAGATVVVMPILLVFLAFQRRFIEGIATTGIK